MAFTAAEAKCTSVIAHEGYPFAGIAGLRAEIARFDTHIGGVLVEMYFSLITFTAFKFLWFCMLSHSDKQIALNLICAPDRLLEFLRSAAGTKPHCRLQQNHHTQRSTYPERYILSGALFQYQNGLCDPNRLWRSCRSLPRMSRTFIPRAPMTTR